MTNIQTLCVFCEEEIESPKHVYLECEVIQIFWNKINHWFRQKTNLNIRLNIEEIMFGTMNSNMAGIDCIYLIAKHYIYSCRFKEVHPTLKAFEYKINQFIQTERFIAVKNNTSNIFN